LGPEKMEMKRRKTKKTQRMEKKRLKKKTNEEASNILKNK
jgi:hypothetical protein